MIRAVDIKPGRKEEITSLLNLLLERAERGEMRALLAVEVRANLNEPTMLHDAGDIHYAEIVGYLEMAKMNLHAKSAGMIDP